MYGVSGNGTGYEYRQVETYGTNVSRVKFSSENPRAKFDIVPADCDVSDSDIDESLFEFSGRVSRGG